MCYINILITIVTLAGSGVDSPTIYSRYANFKLLSSVISLEIDCFHSQRTPNICIAGLNRRAGYATAGGTLLRVGLLAILPQ